MILMNQSRKSLEKDRDSTTWLLQQLGFVVNWEKANLIAQQCVVYMGFTINSLAMTLALHNIQQECQNIVDKSICSSQSIITIDRQTHRLRYGRVTGSSTLSASTDAENESVIQWRSKLQHHVDIDPRLSRGNSMVAILPEGLAWQAIITPVPNLIITSDASMKGWGSVCNGVTTQGMWNKQEQSLHINTLDVEPTGAITP